MFDQYLHPDLILFSKSFDPSAKCPYKYQMIDGQIVIYQKIDRFMLTVGQQLLKLQSHLKDKNNHNDNYQDEDDDLFYPKNEGYEDYDHENYDYEGESDDEDYYKDDDQDFDNQYKYYEHRANKQDLANQIRQFFNKSPTKTSQVPLLNGVKRQKKDEGAKKQNQNDDEDWLTEEQVEDYVITGEIGLQNIDIVGDEL